MEHESVVDAIGSKPGVGEVWGVELKVEVEVEVEVPSHGDHVTTPGADVMQRSCSLVDSARQIAVRKRERRLERLGERVALREMSTQTNVTAAAVAPRGALAQ